MMATVNLFEVITSTIPLGTLDSIAFSLAAILYQDESGVKHLNKQPNQMTSYICMHAYVSA